VHHHIEDAAFPRYYAAADAFVLPSRGEGWGRPHVEAMSMARFARAPRRAAAPPRSFPPPAPKQRSPPGAAAAAGRPPLVARAASSWIGGAAVHSSSARG